MNDGYENLITNLVDIGRTCEENGDVPNIKRSMCCRFCKKDTHTISKCRDEGIHALHATLLCNINELANKKRTNYIEYCVDGLTTIELLVLYNKYKIPTKWYSSVKRRCLGEIYKEMYENYICKGKSESNILPEFIATVKKKYEILFNQIKSTSNISLFNSINEKVRKEEKKELEEIETKVSSYKKMITEEISFDIDGVVNPLLYNYLLTTEQSLIANFVKEYKKKLMDNRLLRIRITTPLYKPFNILENESCPICLDELDPSNAVNTDCNHLHCYTCIKTCIANSYNNDKIKNQAKCSICRSIINKLYCC